MATNYYYPKSVLETLPIELWNSNIPLISLEDWSKQIDTKGYFVGNQQVLDLIIAYERKERKAMDKKTKEFKEFIQGIVEEHYNITKKVDQNLNYLWHLYLKGGKVGQYKPFILMAEMQLLKEMGYMDDEQIDNLWKMLNSEDEDNFNIAYLALRHFKSQRIKEHGAYGMGSTFAYMNVEKDYPVKVLNHELFLKYLK